MFIGMEDERPQKRLGRNRLPGVYISCFLYMETEPMDFQILVRKNQYSASHFVAEVILFSDFPAHLNAFLTGSIPGMLIPQYLFQRRGFLQCNLD